MLLLQEFDFLIVHTPGRLHVVADFLSKMENGEPVYRISDELPDAQIFSAESEVVSLRQTDGMRRRDLAHPTCATAWF